MKNIFIISTCLLAMLVPSTSSPQKKIVVLGSSTAYGYGASVRDSSWVGRLQASFRKDETDGVDTIIDNLAMPSYVSYKGMPSDYTMPPNRTNPDWAPDPVRNITAVLNMNPRPDIVILSYPTNDANLPDYREKETMDNLRLMSQSLTNAGIHTYITTSQPRNDMTDAQRTMLRELRDSIINNFGVYSINFWDDLVTNDGLNHLKNEVNSGDGVHPNNLGHRLLFQRVRGKNIFSLSGSPLPLVLENWQAWLENKVVIIKWRASCDEFNTIFDVQRSVDNKIFKNICRKKAVSLSADYTWEDVSPVTGKSFYRLKIIEPAKTSYSGTIAVMNDKKQLITSLYADANQLHVQLNTDRNQPVVLTIISYTGTILKRQSFRLNNFNSSLDIPISELPFGDYFLRVTTADGSTAALAFARMK